MEFFAFIETIEKVRKQTVASNPLVSLSLGLIIFICFISNVICYLVLNII